MNRAHVAVFVATLRRTYRCVLAPLHLLQDKRGLALDEPGPTSRTPSVTLAWPHSLKWSGCRDSNPGPLIPSPILCVLQRMSTRVSLFKTPANI